MEDNNSYKSVRISIEWNYMNTANLFRYLKNLNKLKVMNGEVVIMVYIVCTILRNCHIALYGGISSQYFGLSLPHDMLERYMRCLFLLIKLLNSQYKQLLSLFEISSENSLST